MIRLLIAHEIQLTCNILAAVLDEVPDITVVACATEAKDALAAVAECDVALVSTGFGPAGRPAGVHDDLLALIREMKETAPATKVVIVGLAESKEHVLPYMHAGAFGYVLPDDSVDDLVTRLRAAADDKALISPDIAAAVITRLNELSQVAFASRSTGRGSLDLTPRELEILGLIEQGLANQEIAEELRIEVGTVKNHVHSILQKLDVGTRDHAAALASLVPATPARVVDRGGQ